MDDSVLDDQSIWNLLGRCFVCPAQVCRELVAVCEALAVEVADIGRAVDNDGPGNEVVLPLAEVVHSLVLVRVNRHDHPDIGLPRRMLVCTGLRRGRLLAGSGLCLARGER